MMELSYRRHRFPPVVIQHAVWLYLRFTLSYRDVEDLLAERGVDVSYETVRSWGLKFGPVIARRLRRRRPRPSDRWHLDEMVVRIAGKRMYLWRAVDHEGEVLDMLVQSRRDSRAAMRLMRKLLRKQGFVPKLLVTDKLRSYGSAFRRLQLTCPHEQGLRKNNRAENSHQPVRRPHHCAGIRALQPWCLEHREGKPGAFRSPNRHRQTMRRFFLQPYYLPLQRTGRNDACLSLYWRSRAQLPTGHPPWPIRRGTCLAEVLQAQEMAR